jgi:hypothetical protein
MYHAEENIQGKCHHQDDHNDHDDMNPPPPLVVVEHTSPKARFGRRGFHKPNLGDFWLIAGHFGSLCNFCSLSDALTYDGMACDTNGLSPARQYIEVVEESVV